MSEEQRINDSAELMKRVTETLVETMKGIYGELEIDPVLAKSEASRAAALTVSGLLAIRSTLVEKGIPDQVVPGLIHQMVSEAMTFGSKDHG